MTKRLELPKFQAFDSNGDPLSGGLVYTYEAGTSTNKETYSDPAGSVANANPVVLDSRGEADIYVNGAYKIVLKTSADVTIWTLDNVEGGLGSAAMDGYHYPDATAADQGITGDSDTIKYAVDSIGSDTSTIYQRHDSGNATTEYTLTTAETIPDNINLIFENGAVLDGAGTLTLDNSDQIIAKPNQQIFGSSILVVFTNGGTVYPEWWGVDGTADDVQLQAAMTSGGSAGISIELMQDLTVAAAVTPLANTKIFSNNRSTITAVNSMDDNVFEINASNITIDGIISDGNKASQASGSFVNCADQAGTIDNLSVKNCEITDFKEYGVFIENQCTNIEIINNKIDGCDATAVELVATTVTETIDNIRMEGNHIIDAGVNGLQVYNSTNLNNSNVIITNNHLVNIGVVPIDIQRGYRAVVTDNILDGGANGISIGEFNRVVVANNVVQDQTYSGVELVYLDGGGNGIANANQIYNCGTGIIANVNPSTDKASKISVTNNIIQDTTSQEGIEVSSFDEVVVTGNIVKDPYTVGIRVGGLTAGTNQVSDVVISDNVVRFEQAIADGPTGITFQGIERGIISNNLVVSAVSGTNQYSSLIVIGAYSRNLQITGNVLIGTVPLDHRGIYSSNINSYNIYILRNIIKNMIYGVQTSACQDPRTVISDNIIEDSSTGDVYAHNSHKVDRLASSPTQGALWKVGDVAWETAPTASNPPGWVCVSRVKTEMRVAAGATATTMEVDSTTGMTAGDIVGVELDDGTWHWTTVASVTDGDTFELTAGLSGDGAAIDNDVVTNLWKAMASLAA